MCFCKCKYSTDGESAVDKMKIEPVTKILLNTVTISEVNLTAIDSHFAARETQDYVPLQHHTTNSQTISHNFKTLN